MCRIVRVAVILALVAMAGHATVFQVPTDEALAGRADAIVVGTIVRVDYTPAARGGIDSLITLRVEESLRGSLPCEITIREAGGLLGDRIEVSDAAPLYGTSSRVLVFLEATDEGWTTWGGALGKFDFVATQSGGEALVRADRFGEIYGIDDDGRRHVERPREAAGFLSYIRANAAGERREPNYFLPAGEKLRPESDVSISPDTTTHNAASFNTKICTSGITPVCFPMRWFAFATGGSVSFKSKGSPAAESATVAIANAFAAWNGDAGSNVNLTYGGTTSNTWNAEDAVNVISFNEPVGVLALSLQRAGDVRTFDGQSWAVLSEVDLALSASPDFANTVFLEEIIAHELGHCLGFRHSDRGPKTPSEQLCDSATMDCTASAIMRGVTLKQSLFGPNLQPWEVDAVRLTYPETGPVVNQITPNTGPTIGGTVVTISGANFTGTPTVTFGGTTAVVNSATATSINVVTPQRANAGAVDVVVTNPDNKAGTKSGGFTYQLTEATLTGIDVVAGPTTGGTAVTLTGTLFFGNVGVTFGGADASNVVLVNSSTITCTTSAHAAGAVDIVVTNGDGGTSASLTDGFAYQLLPPTLDSLNPTSGPQTGGTDVTITGANFVAPATVDFGGAAATNVIVVSPTSITLTTPAHAVGVVDVTVTCAGQPVTKTDAFTFEEVVLAPGDVNGTGAIDGADVIYLVNFLFGDGPSPLGSGDVNNDTFVDAMDLFYLINFIFASGPPPIF